MYQNIATKGTRGQDVYSASNSVTVLGIIIANSQFFIPTMLISWLFI